MESGVGEMYLMPAQRTKQIDEDTFVPRMTPSVRQRLMQMIDEVIVNHGFKDYNSFCERHGLYRTYINELRSTLDKPNEKLMKVLFQEYNANPVFIFYGEGTPFLSPVYNSDPPAPREPVKEGTKVVFVHNDNFSQYADSYSNTEYIDSLPYTFIPFLDKQIYRAFEVADEALIGTLFPSDWLICTPVRDLNDIKNHEVHVIVIPGRVLIRRVNRNGLLEDNKLELYADNKVIYLPRTMYTDEILQVWRIHYKFSRLISVENQLERRVAALEIRLSEVMKDREP